MSRKKLKQKHAEAYEKYIELKGKRADEVSNTEQPVALRNYQLRKKKIKGVIRKKEVTLSQVLFPGVSPEEYALNEELPMFAELVESKKTQVPFEYYNLPVCSIHPIAKKYYKRKNLGSNLQGRDPKPSPFPVRVGNDGGCTPICKVNIGGTKSAGFACFDDKQGVELYYSRIPNWFHGSRLIHSTEAHNDEYYLYNHLKFTITYKEDSDFEGVRITGFEVHPVSVNHTFDGDLQSNSVIATCNADGSDEVINNPSSYLALRGGSTGEPLSVIYSYEVA
eukprot:scaffold81170_cov65-Attheya_sp.AAC.3